jgi:Ca-activated chloride channel homolog
MNELALALTRPAALWLLAIVPVALVIGLRFARSRGIAPRVVWLRVALFALLVLAASDPLLTTSDRSSTTLLVIDRSSSIDVAHAAEVESWLGDALDAAESSDRAAVVTFGSTPDLLYPLTEVSGLSTDLPALDDAGAGATNIEAALAMARALPVRGDRRVVLVSDGAENLGDAIEQANQLAAAEIPVDVVPLPGIGAEDFRLAGVSGPDTVWYGESISLLVSAFAPDAVRGAIDVMVDGALLASYDVAFDGGLSSHVVEIEGLEPGFHSLLVRVVPDSVADRIPENNESMLSLVVRDEPALLLVSPERVDSTFLATALEANGASVTSMPPSGIPDRLSDLSQFDIVVLNNVPAAALTVGQVASLESLTREHGRGLIVVGGTSAYGPGGYSGTDLEALLPVTVKVTDGTARQRVALLLIVDKSGSMATDPLHATSKIDMAREAAHLAADVMLDGDEIGVLVFNDKQEWIVPLATVGGPEDRSRIHAAIDTIAAAGGTEIYPALSVGLDSISNASTEVRHVVLLSDGKSSTGTRESYDKLIASLDAAGATLSTIAVGEDADTDLLQYLAEQGRGNYHATLRAEDIPVLTVAEAEGVGSQSIIRGSFVPVQVGSSPIMAGFSPEALPPVDGYDFAEAKEGAQVVLASPREDPLLAKWQFGLGRVVSWTADDGVDLALPWRTWNRTTEFWRHIVQWALPDPQQGPISVEVARDGPDAVVSITSHGGIDSMADLTRARVRIVSPDGAVTENLSLYRSGPQEYEMRIARPPAGAYQFEIDLGDGSRPVLAGFSIPHSPELQPDPDGGARLEVIASMTGGRVLTLEEPDRVFSGATRADGYVETYWPLWRPLLAIALLIFLTELVFRYRSSSWLAGGRDHAGPLLRRDKRAAPRP